MTRAVLYIILAVLVISVLRGVIGILAKGLGDFVNPAPPGAARRPPVPAGGELKKDPVCGTFISPATAVQKKVRGETYYFCSAECRDRFKG